VRFKLNEDMPASAGDVVKAAGHEVATVHEEALGGAADEIIADICKAEEMILITLDLDFASVISYPPSTHPGIMVIRVARASAAKVNAIMREVFTSTDVEHLRGTISIAEPGRVRLRR